MKMRCAITLAITCYLACFFTLIHPKILCFQADGLLVDRLQWDLRQTYETAQPSSQGSQKFPRIDSKLVVFNGPGKPPKFLDELLLLSSILKRGMAQFFYCFIFRCECIDEIWIRGKQWI